jgi:DNA-binding MarR family transcriptional regulator
VAIKPERSDSLFRMGQRARVLQLLRSYTDDHVELSRHLALALGVHVTDAIAVAELLWAETADKPLSPARLAERIGLTSGATASLLNRLEVAGHLIRSREDADRRVVTLRLTPDARAKTIGFFIPTGERIDRVLDEYDGAALENVEDLLTAIVAVTAARNAYLRAHPPK